MALILCGCVAPAPTSSAASEQPLISDLEYLKPYALSGTQSNLRLGGTDLLVNHRVERQKDSLRLALTRNGAEFEHEKYQFSNQNFSLAETSEEQFVPPVPLLRFPMRIGDEWRWDGQMVSGGHTRNAHASVTSESSTSFGQTGAQQTLHVIVDLQMAAATGSHSSRRLEFWFEKDRGVVRRAFGDASVREVLP